MSWVIYYNSHGYPNQFYRPTLEEAEVIAEGLKKLKHVSEVEEPKEVEDE